MKLVFIGPQGSGKGTQAKRIAAKIGACHVSTGDLLRNAEGDLKKEVESVMDKGELVGDDLIIKILKDRLSKPDCQGGYILDGFPRNSVQAEALKDIAEVDRVIEIVISDDESVRRVLGRRNCEKCGAIFNVNTSPKPKVEGVCDFCGGKLFARKDDNEEALRKRLAVYHKETQAVLKMFRFARIDGMKSIDEVENEILESIGQLDKVSLS
jgi:adenylate kinase